MKLIFRSIAVLAFAALIVSISACRSTGHAGPPADLEAPEYADLIAAHNKRVSQLQRVQSRGVLEIVWRDEDGARRFRQGDVDLYIDLPRRTALRVTKLGNVYMWLGSDAERYWLFDLVDEPILYAGRHSSRGDQTFHTVQPLALLDLIGLGPMSPIDDRHQDVVYDDELDAWVALGMGGGGPVRMYFDRATWLPMGVEALTQEGDVAYISDIMMNRYRSVPVPGISAATLPRMATLVDIVSAGPDAEAQGAVKLALDTPTGRVDERAFERVFDIARLISSLRPRRVEGNVTDE